MTVCKFFQQGSCKFGNSCRFEHPGSGGGQGSNRFGVFSSSNNSQLQRGLDKYFIKLESIEADLTTETPGWILSAYAPGRDAPDQLFGGYPREQSFEEMRLHYMKGKAEGNEQKALAEAQELYQNAQAQMQTAVRSVNEAATFLIEGENRHPNRLDICREGTQGAPFGEFLVGKRPKSIAPAQPAAANPFATNNNNTTSVPSPFGAAAPKPSPFGAPAFGQPAQPASAFGQPSQPVFGQPSQPAAGFGFGQAAQKPNPFGQPSQPSQQQHPAFGQPSQPAAPSAFGQPSALGAKPSPFGAPAFGQAAQPAAANNNQPASAFGQPSQLGQKPNPFGGNASAGPSPFAAANNNNNNQPSNNPFSNPQTNNQTNQPPPSNPFGAAPAGNQANQPPSNPFGSQAPAQNSPSPFGKPASAPASNPFASGGGNTTAPGGNPFSSGGQQTNGGGGPAANPFAAPTQPNPPGALNPFGSGTPSAPAQPPAAQPATGPAGNPYLPGSAKRHPAAESYITKNADGTLAAFKGKAVTYSDGKPGIRAFDGRWTRIWFPNGPPNYYKDTELPVDAYDDTTKAQWQKFEQTGTFTDGVMPALPPPRECTVWDF